MGFDATYYTIQEPLWKKFLSHRNRVRQAIESLHGTLILVYQVVPLHVYVVCVHANISVCIYSLPHPLML